MGGHRVILDHQDLARRPVRLTARHAFPPATPWRLALSGVPGRWCCPWPPVLPPAAGRCPRRPTATPHRRLLPLTADCCPRRPAVREISPAGDSHGRPPS